jgi:hypothetical protein
MSTPTFSLVCRWGGSGVEGPFSASSLPLLLALLPAPPQITKVQECATERSVIDALLHFFKCLSCSLLWGPQSTVLNAPFQH